VNRTLRTLVVYGLSIILLAVLAQWWFDQVQGPEEVTLSEFMEKVEGGTFSEVQILARSNQVQGRIEPGTDAADAWDFVASYPEGYEGHWNDCRKKGPYAAKQLQIDDVSFMRALVPRSRHSDFASGFASVPPAMPSRSARSFTGPEPAAVISAHRMR